jgi:hypothetical protein
MSSILSVTLARSPAKLTPKSRRTGLFALEQIRKMRGGTQPYLMRCSDGAYYVVKFQNNPQGSRILANELICSRLAARLGLPVANGVVVAVDQGLIQDTDELRVELPRRWKLCQGGRCFGSRFLGDPSQTALRDMLPPNQLRVCHNGEDFLGMLVFDVWTSNIDNRQVVFVPYGEPYRYSAVMIDHGLCFGGQAWELSADGCRFLYLDKIPYENVSGIEQFEPWLSRLEGEIDENFLKAATSELPEEWYGCETAALHRLLEQLNDRRTEVRRLIAALTKSTPRFFPNWGQIGSQCATAG